MAARLVRKLGTVFLTILFFFLVFSKAVEILDDSSSSTSSSADPNEHNEHNENFTISQFDVDLGLSSATRFSFSSDVMNPNSGESFLLVCNEHGCQPAGKFVPSSSVNGGGVTYYPVYPQKTTPTWPLLPSADAPISKDILPPESPVPFDDTRIYFTILYAGGIFLLSVFLGALLGVYNRTLRKFLRVCILRFLNPSYPEAPSAPSSPKTNNSNDGDENYSKKSDISLPPALAHLHSLLADNRVLQVGHLFVCTDKILGYGSMGTVVFEGYTQDGRRVAVKRMLSQFFRLANSEISLLCESDTHANVVRYHAKEEDGEFVYLALELCTQTLADWFEARTTGDENDPATQEFIANFKPMHLSLSTTRRIVKDLFTGVSHLHSLAIVHRDLKPQNVLVTTSSPRTAQVKISDMGVAKKLDSGRVSFSTQAFGSIGWQAPEVITGGRLTDKVDVFCCGCIAFYLLTGGKHPYGQRFERELNIVKGNVTELRPLPCFSLDKSSAAAAVRNSSKRPPPGLGLDLSLSSMKNRRDDNSTTPTLADLPEARDLIFRMVYLDAPQRPSMEEAVCHPFLWTNQQKLLFLQDLSDFIEYASSFAVDKQLPLLMGQTGNVRREKVERMKNRRINGVGGGGGGGDPGNESDNEELPSGMTGVACLLIEALERHDRDIIGFHPSQKYRSSTMVYVPPQQSSKPDWKLFLDEELIADLNRFRKAGYSGNSVCDLLRVIRNKSRHFRQLAPSLQKILGGSQTGLLVYFMAQFPLLLTLCFRTVVRIINDPELVSKYAERWEDVDNPDSRIQMTPKLLQEMRENDLSALRALASGARTCDDF